jgi:methyl-accepting chemotaxis protein
VAHVDALTYTAKEQLEIDGSRLFVACYLVLTLLASILQLTGGTKIAQIIPTFAVETGVALAGIIICRKKKRRESAAALIWGVAFVTFFVSAASRYIYVKEYDWLYAAQSINVYGVQIFVLITLQFLYDRKVNFVFVILHIINWVVFIILAHAVGGLPLHIAGKIDGVPYHGIMIERDMFFVIVMGIVGYVSYRNIPAIESFDETTRRQAEQIGIQMDKQTGLVNGIQSKAGTMSELIQSQTGQIADFNKQIEVQASTFEEISATMEELLGSSESISKTSREVLSKNLSLEGEIEGYKAAKEETKSALNTTFHVMTNVVAKTDIGREKLGNLEDTMNRMKEQSTRINTATEVIVDIADKINLLSLNASIEAARAGDSGRGFAVVADEIGKLAAQTGESIKDISLVLGMNRSATADGMDKIRVTSEVINEIISDIRNGSQSVEALKTRIDAEEVLIDGITRQLVDNIELARNTDLGTNEQKTAIESTTKAMEHMNEVLSQMVSGINVISSDAVKINEHSSELLALSQKSV